MFMNFIPSSNSHFQLYSKVSSNHNKQSKSRLLRQVTQNVNLLFRMAYNQSPKRFLIQPAIGVYNDGNDNENNDLIVRYLDIVSNNKINLNYQIIEELGTGTFGQVYKCVCFRDMQQYAIKIIKNINSYSIQATKEIKILRSLNKYQREIQNYTIVSLQDYFLYKNHVCLVFPLLGVSLLDLLRETKFQGLSLQMIKVIMKQLLEALNYIHSHNYVHCDLKPENILFKSQITSEICIIDFGSASEISFNGFYYIQSLFYRAPEVILGANKTTQIDLWSVGCIAAELYLGYPLLQGTSSYDQLKIIIELLQVIQLIRNIQQIGCINGSKFDNYFNLKQKCQEICLYELKSRTEYEEFNQCRLPVEGKLIRQSIDSLMLDFDQSSLRQIQEMALIEDFMDFLKCLLVFEPDRRMSAATALNHKFLKENQFDLRSFLRNKLEEN